MWVSCCFSRGCPSKRQPVEEGSNGGGARDAAASESSLPASVATVATAPGAAQDVASNSPLSHRGFRLFKLGGWSSDNSTRRSRHWLGESSATTTRALGWIVLQNQLVFYAFWHSMHSESECTKGGSWSREPTTPQSGEIDNRQTGCSVLNLWWKKPQLPNWQQMFECCLANSNKSCSFLNQPCRWFIAIPQFVVRWCINFIKSGRSTVTLIICVDNSGKWSINKITACLPSVSHCYEKRNRQFGTSSNTLLALAPS